MRGYASWGNYPNAQQEATTQRWRNDPIPVPDEPRTVLPRGLGRSYGDSCLNDGGVLIDATRLDHFLEFDAEAGSLRCEAGVSLETILELAVPAGWFIPVTPGTKFVTVGGAIANDVHGKNHHRAGTFGRFVTRFELLRSDGSRHLCSPDENAELFRATIGGLGLTGLITWVELRLKRVAGPLIDCESVRFGNLDEFFELARTSDENFEYTVAWVDCMARGTALGRGLFLRGNHRASDNGAGRRPSRRQIGSIPLFAPGFVLHPLGVRAFNTLYYRRQRRPVVRRTVDYDPFFYPLDAVDNWNRLYGRRGFMQHQCVVPHDSGRDGIREIFQRIAESGHGSSLAVLKVFGDVASPGLLSFPRPGVTLALDFANRGRSVFELLNTLDGIVRRCGGRVYPAKDARMSAENFQSFFPEWRELSRWVDPRFSSSFWRRVTVG